MRLIDADELTEAVWRERLDTRERIADLVARQPTVKTDVQAAFDKMRLIDADALKDSLSAISLIFRDTERNTLADDILHKTVPAIIDAEPTADVQPVKHGRWIFQNRNDEDGRYIYHCSECDFEVKVFPCNFLPWVMHEKYCPGCGARMDGDRE